METSLENPYSSATSKQISCVILYKNLDFSLCASLLVVPTIRLPHLELNQVKRKGTAISHRADYINHSGKQYP